MVAQRAIFDRVVAARYRFGAGVRRRRGHHRSLEAVEANGHRMELTLAADVVALVRSRSRLLESTIQGRRFDWRSNSGRDRVRRFRWSDPARAGTMVGEPLHALLRPAPADRE